MRNSTLFFTLLISCIAILSFSSCNKKFYPPFDKDTRKDVEKLVDNWALMMNQDDGLKYVDSIYHPSFISYRGKGFGGYNSNKLNVFQDSLQTVKNGFNVEVKIHNTVYATDNSKVAIYFILKKQKKGQDNYVYNECIVYLQLNTGRIRKELVLMGPTEPEEPPFGGGGEYE